MKLKYYHIIFGGLGLIVIAAIAYTVRKERLEQAEKEAEIARTQPYKQTARDAATRYRNSNYVVNQITGNGVNVGAGFVARRRTGEEGFVEAIEACNTRDRVLSIVHDHIVNYPKHLLNPEYPRRNAFSFINYYFLELRLQQIEVYKNIILQHYGVQFISNEPHVLVRRDNRDTSTI